VKYRIIYCRWGIRFHYEYRSTAVGACKRAQKRCVDDPEYSRPKYARIEARWGESNWVTVATVTKDSVVTQLERPDMTATRNKIADLQTELDGMQKEIDDMEAIQCEPA
jgi:hypothetical protein